MNELIDLSLTIVTYNNSKIIGDTIKSVVENIPQELSYRLYIVDNNSTDRTVELVREMDLNIEILPLKVNKGFGYGHNQILDLINSRYHLVVNPDIMLEDKDQIRKMVKYLDENPQVGMLSPLILNPDHTIQYLCKTNPTVFDMLIRRISSKLFPKRQDRYVMKETGYNKIMPIEYASGSFMVFRTDLFKKIGGFDDAFFMYLEDADITRRINEIAASVFFPQAQVIHLWQREGHKKIKYALITAESMKVYFKKWGWKLF
ncbi:MAG: glycosyltransferase family 2 protein [Eubacteriaceae bacterium]|nr:glycosyltransferase family 2 protein [Eubacteriaceae bacterium]